MNAYVIIKSIHVLAAIAFVGPLSLALRWLALSRENIAQQMLHDLHLQTGIAGWIVLISGAAMLYITGGGFLYSLWMQVAIGLYLLIQVFDHFWADKREDQLAGGQLSVMQPLRAWLALKLAIYCAIAVMMVLKP